MGCSTVNCKETPLDDILRRIDMLEKDNKDMKAAMFNIIDNQTTSLSKDDIHSSKITWLDNQVLILNKRLTHHLNETKWHYEGQPVIK